MEISKSVFSLAKSNNGFFKSEKQSAFLIFQMSRFGGCIGHVSSGHNLCPVFANWDEKGITKIVKATKKGDVLMFERKQEGVLTALETKEIKRLEKRLKQIKKEVSENSVIFLSGKWNGSGDTSTYDYHTVELYCYYQQERINSINWINEKIKTINS